MFTSCMEKCMLNLNVHIRKFIRLQNIQYAKRTLTTRTLAAPTCISRNTSISPYHIKPTFRTMFTGILNSKDSVSITFIDRVGATRTVQANIDDTLLDVAKDNDVDGIEGACDGTLACSTCHCIFTQEDYDRLELEDISEDELDMLDLAYGLTDTSRLGCAVDITKEMDGIVIQVPKSTIDVR